MTDALLCSFTRAQPYLEKMGARFIYCGQSGNGLYVSLLALLSESSFKLQALPFFLDPLLCDPSRP